MAHVVVIVAGYLALLGLAAANLAFISVLVDLILNTLHCSYSIRAEEDNTRSSTPRFSTRTALETVPSFVSIPTVTRNPNS